MATLKICSWNVNGLRAAIRSGDFPNWLATSAPDIVGLQEVKAGPGQVDPAPWLDHGYAAWWHTAERAGYSSSVLLSRPHPMAVRTGIGIAEYDREGRLIEAYYPGFTLVAAYFPNGSRDQRLDFKLAFFAAFLARVEALRAAGASVVFMGDLNVAHHEIDLARPREARNQSGFLPVERAWLDRFTAAGFVDAFRTLHPGTRDAYTYWDAWRERRARNVGWRIDYVFVSEDLLPRVRSAFIEAGVFGSDHCPVGIEMDV